METVHIGISEANRKAVAGALSEILADMIVLGMKTRNAHWNVKGIDFMDKHELFGKQYDLINGEIDEVAERIRILGHAAPGSLAEILALTHLNENTGTLEKSEHWMSVLLQNHEQLIQKLRGLVDLINNKYQDVGTADFLTSIMEEHEKTAWFLRAHL